MCQREQQQRRHRAHQGQRHVGLGVPHVALRTEEGGRGLPRSRGDGDDVCIPAPVARGALCGEELAVADDRAEDVGRAARVGAVGQGRVETEALAPLAPLLGDGRMGVVAGVGFPEPDRSHFAALDMWWSATPGETFRTGWLGRWLDATSGPDDVVLRSTGLGGAAWPRQAAGGDALAAGTQDAARQAPTTLGSGSPGWWRAALG